MTLMFIQFLLNQAKNHYFAEQAFFIKRLEQVEDYFVS